MKQWVLVVAAGVTIFTAQLDSTIVLIALPHIQQHFIASPALVQWVTLGYIAPLIALSLLAGRWIDLVGRRAALIIGLGSFALASAAAGSAPGVAWLIVARVVQGAAGAVLMAVAPVLAVTSVSTVRRARALAVVATLGPIGAMAGPTIGGRLLDTLGWSWIFYVNVPLLGAVLLTAVILLPADGRLRAPRRSWLAEAMTFGGAALAILLGLSLALTGDPRWVLVALLAVPLIVVWRRSAVSRPVRGVLVLPGMARLHLGFATVYTALMAVQYLSPYFLQEVLTVTATVAGAVLLAYPLASAAVAPVSGLLTDRFGANLPLIIGVCTLTAAIATIVPLHDHWEPIDLTWRLALMGVGVGLVLTPLQSAALALAPPEQLATTSASTNVGRHVGLALGPALSTAIWALHGYTVAGMRVALILALLCGAATLVSALPARPGQRVVSAEEVGS